MCTPPGGTRWFVGLLTLIAVCATAASGQGRGAAVKATADLYCGRSLTTARADTNVRKILNQLLTNADRNRRLVRETPFQMTMAREVGYLSGQKRDTGLTSVRRDTVQRMSTRSWRYAPPRPSDPPLTGDGMGDVVNVLELADVSDSVFLDNHCWQYRGLETVEGQRLLRVDVAPVKNLRGPDITGSFYLDMTTLALRRSIVFVTRVFGGSQSVEQRISAETIYREQHPGVPMAVQVTTIVERTVDQQCVNTGTAVVCPAEVRIITKETQRLIAGGG